MATILHVDMDAFFASVEQRDHPEWRGKPVIVGADPHARGVVSTCSYEARPFGVRSAMPTRTAYALCPTAIFTPPDLARYKAASEEVFEVFSHYSPFVEAVSIDEAFLDVTGTVHLFGGDARRLGEALRREVRETCRLTCSVGIASNRLLAKIGSDENKPDGLTLMPRDPNEIAAFLAPRPIRILWGVGEKTIESLRPYGIATCGDLQKMRANTLIPPSLIDLAFGRSEATVHWQAREEKSVSREYTFSRDEASRARIRAKLMELAAEVGYHVRQKSRWATTARLKLRDANFEMHTRQMTLPRPACDDRAFREAAAALLDEAYPIGTRARLSTRLVGFAVANFRDTPDGGQDLLFPSQDETRRRRDESLSRALDDLRRRGIACGSRPTL